MKEKILANKIKKNQKTKKTQTNQKKKKEMIEICKEFEIHNILYQNLICPVWKKSNPVCKQRTPSIQ